MKYEKKTKNKRLNSRIGLNIGKIIFLNTHACARGCENFSSYNENMRKEDLFKLDRNTFGKTRF